MTQEQMNKIFKGDLGQQCNSLFTTADDEVFIRYEEAKNYTHDILESDDFSTITEWWEDDLG